MQANMQETLGGIYQKLGKLDLADPLLAAALAERRGLAPGDNRKVAESLVAMGLLRKDQGKLDESEALVRQGIEMSQRMLSDSSPDAARVDLLRAMVAQGHLRHGMREVSHFMDPALGSDSGYADPVNIRVEQVGAMTGRIHPAHRPSGARARTDTGSRRANGNCRMPLRPCRHYRLRELALFALQSKVAYFQPVHSLERRDPARSRLR
jgi:hypothetical protein